jgi:hypothetical protein
MGHVPLSTMSRLASLKLAEIDPAELRVAARLPDALEPRSHGVKVRIDVAGMQHGKDSATELILEPAVEPSELAPLSAQRRAGHRIWAYRLSHSDVDRLKALIAAASGASGVSIAAGVEACYRKPYGSAALPTTTFLKTNATGFFVLTGMNSFRTYSITSFARASRFGGTVMPSAFAVLRLIANPYLVGACTGRFAGFSPLRMRSI